MFYEYKSFLFKKLPNTPEPTMIPNPNWAISLFSLKHDKVFVVISKTEQPKANKIPAV